MYLWYDLLDTVFYRTCLNCISYQIVVDDKKDPCNQLVEWSLIDAYPQRDKMVFWVKQTNVNTIRLEDNWSISIDVTGDNKSDLKSILSVIVAVQSKNNNNVDWLIKDH